MQCDLVLECWLCKYKAGSCMSGSLHTVQCDPSTAIVTHSAISAYHTKYVSSEHLTVTTKGKGKTFLGRSLRYARRQKR